ncbi:MAG: hypothetical protein R3300_01655 [Candidatus Promineifilaceae bacterium]|nr:hypothetical protein [Candidatus Promineifilaceae bacterium]
MSALFSSLQGHSKSIFTVAAVVLVFNAAAAGLAAFTEMAVTGEMLKEIFQSAGYGLAFVGGLALYPALAEEGGWLSRIGALLASLGVLAGTVLLTVALLNAANILAAEPSWVNPVGIGIGLGQLALALFGLAALRRKALPTSAGLALFGPLLVFIFFIVGAGVFGEEAVPYWVPFLTVSAQTVAHLAIASSLPGDEQVAAVAQPQEPRTA